jgi:hypothetical protein
VAGAHVIAAARRHLDTDRMVPSFLIVGAQKAGTSSMFQYLNQHPNVLRSIRKDVFYFDDNFEKGLTWYRSFFPSLDEKKRSERRLGGEVMTFEGATYYMFHPLAADRIRATLPSTKIVMLLRDPVQRAISHYKHNVNGGLEELSMREAFEREAGRLDGEAERIISQPGYVSHNHNHLSYLARGRYAEQLARWLKVFPQEQMLVLVADDFFHDPDQGFRTVCRFVGMPEISLSAYPQVGAQKTEKTDEAAIAFAKAHFAAPNEQLFAMLGRRYSWL